MKVLITGGAGFIGSHVVDRMLRAGHDICVIDDFSSGSETNLIDAKALASKLSRKLEIIKGSIGDSELWKNLAGADACFHFAAQTSVTLSVQKMDYDFSLNVNPVPMMLNWIKEKGVHYFLYANTAGAFYGNAGKFPTPEDVSPEPLSPYGATKSFFEIYSRAFAASHYDLKNFSTDVNSKNYFTWASLRLANVFGPRQTVKGEAGVVPIFFEKLMAAENPTIFGDGSKTRDYVFVKDVAEAFHLAFEKMQKGSLNTVFNVASGVETTDQRLFDVFFKTFKESKKLGSDKLSKVERVKAVYANVRPGELMRSSLDISKIKQALGWMPSLSFEEAMRETIEAYLGNDGK